MTRTREELAAELERLNHNVRSTVKHETYLAGVELCHFVNEHLPTILAALREPPEPTAEEVERAAVVAWLREQVRFYAEIERWHEMADRYERIAAAIEASEHRAARSRP